MITVTVHRTSAGKVVSFTMSGHAESGPYGHDLVCAGASAVSFGTINAIIALCNVKLHTELKEEGGFLHCQVPKGLDDRTDEKVQLLLEGMLVSLRSIENNYRNHIRIKEKRRR